jgi:predicted acyltransferase
MPINKQIWTPSFTVFTAGLGMLGLGTFFWILDVRGRRRWALPLVIYGTNAIAAYVAAGLLVRIGQAVKVVHDGGKVESAITIGQTAAASWVEHGSAWLQRLNSHMPSIAMPQNTSLAYALLFVLIVLLLMTVLYVCRVFVKV